MVDRTAARPNAVARVSQQGGWILERTTQFEPPHRQHVQAYERLRVRRTAVTPERHPIWLAAATAATLMAYAPRHRRPLQVRLPFDGDRLALTD